MEYSKIALANMMELWTRKARKTGQEKLEKLWNLGKA